MLMMVRQRRGRAEGDQPGVIEVGIGRDGWGGVGPIYKWVWREGVTSQRPLVGRDPLTRAGEEGTVARGRVAGHAQ